MQRILGEALKEVNRRLFEGEENTRIPKDYTLQVQFEIAGMLSAQSVL